MPEAIQRPGRATIRRNPAWAFGYNVAAVPLAALGFLSPVIAAAITLSSVLVAPATAAAVQTRRCPFDRLFGPSRASRGLGPRPGAGVACPGDRPRRFPARLRRRAGRDAADPRRARLGGLGDPGRAQGAVPPGAGRQDARRACHAHRRPPAGAAARPRPRWPGSRCAGWSPSCPAGTGAAGSAWSAASMPSRSWAATIDLREAEIEGGEHPLTLVAIMGGATIYIPNWSSWTWAAPLWAATPRSARSARPAPVRR